MKISNEYNHWNFYPVFNWAGVIFWMVSGHFFHFLPLTCHDLVGGSPTRNLLHQGSQNDTSALMLLRLADIWYNARREKARTNRYDLRGKSGRKAYGSRVDPLWSKVLGKLIQVDQGVRFSSIKKDFGSSFVWPSFTFPKFNLAYESCTVDSADFGLEFLAPGYPSHTWLQFVGPRQSMSLHHPGISRKSWKEWTPWMFNHQSKKKWSRHA